MKHDQIDSLDRSRQTDVSAERIPEEFGEYDRRPRRRNSLYRGRRQILLIYFGLMISHAILFLAAAPRFRTVLLQDSCKAFIWSTALSIGIWLRHKWARYLMSLMQTLSVIAMMIAFPEVYEPGVEAKNQVYLYALAFYFLAHVAVSAVLLVSGDLKRLTSLSYRR